MEDGYLATATHLRYFSSRLAARGGGQIVVVGSYQGVIVGLPVFSLESASSHGLWALCESVRDELRTYGIVLSYFVPTNFREPEPEPDQAVQKTKSYLTGQIEGIFRAESASTQADDLMDGIANQYVYDRRYYSRLEVICKSFRIDWWRMKGMREKTKAWELITYPVRLFFRLYLFYRVHCLLIILLLQYCILITLLIDEEPWRVEE